MTGVKHKSKCNSRSRQPYKKSNASVTPRKMKNRNVGTPVPQKSDEVEIDEDDIAYFEANKSSSSFLLQLNEKTLR